MKTFVIFLNALGVLLFGFLIPSRIKPYAVMGCLVFVAILLLVLRQSKTEAPTSLNKTITGTLSISLLWMGLFFIVKFFQDLLHSSSYGDMHLFAVSTIFLLFASGITTLIYILKK